MNQLTIYELRALFWALKYVRQKTNNCGDVVRTLIPKIEGIIKEKSDEGRIGENRL